jgi:hypothetical protein
MDANCSPRYSIFSLPIKYQYQKANTGGLNIKFPVQQAWKGRKIFRQHLKPGWNRPAKRSDANAHSEQKVASKFCLLNANVPQFTN